MKGTHALSSLDQIKAVADPLRQQILQALCEAPRTTKQVAERLGEKPTKLYHHVDTLERAGLIELVETRQNRGTVEKYYRAVAHRFAVDHALLAVAPEAEEALGELQSMIVNGLRESLAEARQQFAVDLLREGPLPTAFTHTHLRASPRQMKALLKKMETWLSDMQDTAEDGDDPVDFNLTLALFPLQPSSKKT